MSATPPLQRRLEAAAGRMATEAVHRMQENLPWYRALPADDRSWVGMVAHAGIAGFIAWHADQRSQPQVVDEVFGAAPRDLTRTITLQQTLDMVRTSVAVVESGVAQVAQPEEQRDLRDAVLTYSREVAFACAQVYAEAAELRGAWDARLESLVVDAVLRGVADEGLRSRVTALGWNDVKNIVVVAGRAPEGRATEVIDAMRRAASRLGVDALGSVQGPRLVAVLGNVQEPLATVGDLEAFWGPGALVVGPLVPHLFAAGRSARAAQSGYAAAAAWPQAPRPCHADELLAERAIAGEEYARKRLRERVGEALDARSHARETVTAYLADPNLEATARALFVHPNTIRYRLARFADDSGFDVTTSRDAFCVRLALAYEKLRDLHRR